MAILPHHQMFITVSHDLQGSLFVLLMQRSVWGPNGIVCNQYCSISTTLYWLLQIKFKVLAFLGCVPQNKIKLSVNFIIIIIIIIIVSLFPAQCCIGHDCCVCKEFDCKFNKICSRNIGRSAASAREKWQHDSRQNSYIPNNTLLKICVFLNHYGKRGHSSVIFFLCDQMHQYQILDIDAVANQYSSHLSRGTGTS